MNPFEAEIKGKKVLIFGLGRQGGGAGDAKWLDDHGAIVRLSDQDLTLVKEGQTKEQIDWADIVIKNPGVPDNNVLIAYAKQSGKPVYTSIALFVKYADVTTIGVTGTRGKSTTVSLITEILQTAYPGQVISGGNIAGTSGLQLFDLQTNQLYAVLELSSFQLHNFHELQVSPKISVVTNLYPDHLNRYKDMEEYLCDKQAICQYQTPDQLCLYNHDNEGAINIVSVTTAKKIPYLATTVKDWLTTLPGEHNLENISAAWELSHQLGLDESLVQQVVADFVGVPFRQEKIAVKGGVTYINDTTSTTPIAAIKALQSSTGPTIWITGGATKNLPYEELLSEIKTNPNLKKIVILGSKSIPDYTSKLSAIIGEKIIGSASSMSEAIELARTQAISGDSVLLSPGFASFDLFKNEFDRGRQFNECVHSLPA